jgi:DNA modification methylase
MNYNIITADALEALKKMEDNTADLVITSPPYSDIINYGKEISNKKPDDYADWFIPIMNEIYRVLKPHGSFILNINDFCKGGLRSTFIYDLISRNGKEGLLKLYDTYIWHKRNGIPTGGKKRFRNTTEFIFHFCKDNKQMRFYMDRVLQEQSKATSDRRKYAWNLKGHGEVVDGVRGNKKEMNAERLPEKVRPDNVFRFPTASSSRDNLIKHPAPFHKELPLFFVKLLTDECDLVIDIFSGIATTGMACKELMRNYIGIDLNPKYNEFAEIRLKGEYAPETLINQYDLSGNFIQSFSNPSQAGRATGISVNNIDRNLRLNGFLSAVKI